MRRRAGILVCALAFALAGCGGVEVPDPQRSATPFELYTHCGIDELRTDDGRFFERAGGPLTDGSGNPPPGWGNPSQEGELVVAADVAVLTDDSGHREEFRLREGASEFLRLCD